MQKLFLGVKLPGALGLPAAPSPDHSLRSALSGRKHFSTYNFTQKSPTVLAVLPFNCYLNVLPTFESSLSLMKEMHLLPSQTFKVNFSCCTFQICNFSSCGRAPA